MSSKRVLIAAGYLGNWGETDGVVTTYRYLIPELQARGLKAHIIAYGPEDGEEQHGDITVFTHRPRLPLKVDPHRWVDPVIWMTSLGRRIMKTQYDLVQSSTPEFLGRFVWNVARRQSCPFVAIYHTALDQYANIRIRGILGSLAGQAAGRFVYQQMTKYYNHADLVLAPSRCVKSELDERLRVPIEVLSRGVDTQRYHPRFRTRENGKPRALYVGRVAPEKNLQLLTRIFGDFTDAELMIVGDGPYLKEMKAAIPHGLFAGRLNGDALTEAYANADFFVFPSKTDTLGNVVLEGMSSGLPAVVSDVMGPKELVDHGANGFICATDDEFRAAIEQLTHDGEMRQSMGLTARLGAEQRTWGEIAAHLIDFHDQATTNFERNPRRRRRSGETADSSL